MADQTASYSLGEEIANSVTHGVAAIFSVVGLILMVTLAALRSQSAVAVTAASAAIAARRNRKTTRSDEIGSLTLFSKGLSSGMAS